MADLCAPGNCDDRRGAMKALSLTISRAADTLIRKTVRQSAVDDPAVLLVRRDGPRPVNPEWGKAFLGGADRKTLEDLFHKLHDADVKSAHWKIVPSVFPRDHFPSDALVEVSGMAFVFWPALAAMIEGGTLELDESGLVLKDASGTVVNLYPNEQVG